MSNEKQNTQFLINEIANKTGETKKDIDLFLKDFIAIIQNILLKEKLVKIKGLGSFKLSWNESRKSVNVQTGEDIEIPGHYKIVFTPENELRDFVNEPYSHLETVMLDEDDTDASEKEESKINPMKNFSIQAQEIVSLISDMKSNSEKKEEVVLEKEIIKEPKIEPKNIIIENKITVTSDNINNNFTPQKEMKEEELSNGNQTNDTFSSNISSDSVTNTGNQPLKNDKKDAVNADKGTKKKSKGGKWFFILLLLLIAGFAVCWFFVPDSKCVKFVKDKLNLNNEVIALPVDSNAVKKDTTVAIPVDTINNQEDSVYENEDSDNIETPTSVNIFDYKMEYAIARKGTRLAWFSSVYYGSYMFWPYIYLANKETIANPHEIEVGQKIKIPKLPDEMIDINNPSAVARVKYIEEHLDEY